MQSSMHACALNTTSPSLSWSHLCPPPGLSSLLTSLFLDAGTSYYAVAVVRRNSNVTIHTLKGAKSCHTGVNRTVGWNVPIGYLVESGHLSVMGCDVLKGEDLRPSLGPRGSTPPFPAESAQVTLRPRPLGTCKAPPPVRAFPDSSRCGPSLPSAGQAW